MPVRQMLAHASGLQREPIGSIWESLVARPRRLRAGVEDAEQVLPRTTFHYSNLAYGLLGQVIETVAGRDWEVVVRERVLDPLGMTRTGLVPSEDRAHGYQVDPYAGTATEEPIFSLGRRRPGWAMVDGGRHGPLRGLHRGPRWPGRAPETVAEMCRPLIIDRRRRLDRRLRSRLRHGPSR